MTKQKLQEWAVAYIEAEESESVVSEHHPLWWAIDRFIDSSYKNPEEGWEGILAVLWREPSSRVLGALAAGPLEDLIQFHGEAFIHRIEQEARSNPAFRKLLHGVWQSSTEDVWARVQKARGARA